MRWHKMDDEYLQSFDFVAFDTETTGLWAPTNRIVELGAVKFRLGGLTAARFQALVNPERKIPLETIAVHGITDTMVREAETIKPVLQQFMEFCGPDSVLIAHNALFDISFVGCEADRIGLPLMTNPIIDTVDIFRHYQPGLESYSLLALAREYGISRSQNHRATDDAALVWKLFLKISQGFPYIKDFSEFKQHFTLYTMSQWQGQMKELPEEFADLDLAINEGLAVEIIYSTAARPPEKRVIRPQRLHTLKNALYVTAYCEKVEEERTFRLDRIKSFRILR